MTEPICTCCGLKGHAEEKCNIRGSLNITSVIHNLEDKKLWHRIVGEEFPKKIVGEEAACGNIFLNACSAFVEGELPLALFVSAESSAGKDWVCKNVVKFLPRPFYEIKTKLTPEAMAYYHNAAKEPEWTWDGKVLYLPDVRNNVLNSDTMKSLLTEGSDGVSVERGKSIEIKVNGIPAVIFTSANAMPKIEMTNRMGIISLDESEAQTNAILIRQAQDREKTNQTNYDPELRLALCGLNRCRVVIPYASKLTSYFPKKLEARRDFPRFMTLIKSSAALHQYQREKNEEGALIATSQDYQIAKEAFSVMGSAKLPSPLQKAYNACLAYSKNETLGKPRSFTTKEIWAASALCSLQRWYDYTELLKGKGLLHAELKKEGTSDKPVMYFTALEKGAGVTLPLFEEI